MRLGASQTLNGTLCFLCTLDSSVSVLLPHSASLNKAGDANADVELLTGTTGIQPVPTHP